jgi:hypothetical protein
VLHPLQKRPVQKIETLKSHTKARHFIGCVQIGATPVFNWAEGLKQVLFAIQKSVEEPRLVRYR